ncbi:MAG: hypothetical protein DRJ44_07195, partial [Thermoprotei archaeon]
MKHIKKSFGLIFLLLVFSIGTYVYCTSTITTKVNMDSYVVSGGYANDNYGSRDRIFVGKIVLGDTYEMYAFLHFTLPDLPSNAIITKAQLRLRLENKIQFASGEKKAFYVYMVKESWKESTITWNNQPGTDYYVTHFYIEDTTTTP